MQTTRLTVRPIVPDDAAPLFAIETADDVLETWRLRGVRPETLEAYVDGLWKGASEVLTILRVDTGEVVGLCHLYNWQPFEQTAWFSVIVSSAIRHTGLGFEATGLFLRRAFLRWPINRLLAHSLDANFTQMKSLIERPDRGYFRYGTLRGRVLVGGTPMDVHVIGIEREPWMATHGEVIRKAMDRGARSRVDPATPTSLD